MTTQPMPPMNLDPDVVAAEQTRDAFSALSKSLRANVTLTDLQVAQQITEAWTAANATLADHWRSLQARRRARIEVLEQVVPLGPGVPSDASPADAAVINQAFRAALERARTALAETATSTSTYSSSEPISADHSTLRGLLDDAERFDDDVLRRAVLTAAVERGLGQLVRAWTDCVGVTAQLQELERLTAAVSGGGPDALWGKVFTPIPEPNEVAGLQRLETADLASRQARVAAATDGFGGVVNRLGNPPQSMALTTQPRPVLRG